MAYVFVNDMFHFVDKCSLYNYADDNSISTASPCVHDVVSNLKTNCNNIMEWFSVNGLEANPSKFQFMLLSSSNIDNSNISLCIDDITLKPEPHVKILGVFLDDKLSFSQHVSISCTKAARQLNALARISRYLNISSRSLLYNSFVRSNFNYCTMVLHFCGKTNNNKIEKIQERALRIIYRDYESYILPYVFYKKYCNHKPTYNKFTVQPVITWEYIICFTFILVCSVLTYATNSH